MRADAIRVLVLRAAGINCDEETAFAWDQAGARAERVHVNRLKENPAALRDYQILTIPGGFSFGDDIAAGKILANQLAHYLGDELRRFIEDGKLILGICNGFQVLVKSGLLPGDENPSAGGGRVTLAFNTQARYEDRWVYLRTETDRSPWIEKGEVLRMPVAHAEGRFLADSPETLERLSRDARIAFRYVDSSGAPGGFPVNPNGSADNIAGLIDSTGRVLGVMPHPERNIHPRHDPLAGGAGTCSGRRIFDRAVRFVREH